MVFARGQLFEPIGATPSTHILKPNHVDGDYPHSVINEWFIMRLAQRMGLDVPVVHRLYVPAPAPVYVVDRFDRVANPGQTERRHAIDACQLLGLDRSFKYSEGSVEALANTAAMCRWPALVRPKLFAWLSTKIAGQI
ncbi:MAG TPA: HipA domain-containing protein [Limnobacter sp.]|nr:HipA domain-containing protein [Limnobacter sp.]